MNFLEILKASAPLGEGIVHKPIRRASWSYGVSIRWSAGVGVWLFGNIFQPPDDGGRRLELEQMQGCLTPETMLATDWELAAY